jgi:predicted permease
VIGAGYLTVKQGYFKENMVEALMKFAIQFAVPCLLFKATASLDLSKAYDWNLMFSFYIGATISFFSASFLAWKFFGREPATAIAVGFAALFSNSVLLGIPISERAWGVENMAPVFAIISIHAPFCYLLGITSMELLRADGRSLPTTARIVVKAMFSNSLMIGIGLGFLVNLSGLGLPGVVSSAVDIFSASALPAALFGLGGVLTRYKISLALGEIGTISLFSLVIHPSITYFFCSLLGVPDAIARTAVLIAAMAPGVNSYLFASMYHRGQGTAASTVLLGTVMSIFSVSVWLLVLS